MPRGGGDGGGDSEASATDDVPVTNKMKRTGKARTPKRQSVQRKRKGKGSKPWSPTVSLFDDLKIPIKDMG